MHCRESQINATNAIIYVSSQADNLRGHFKMQSDSALLGTTHQLTAIICHPGSSRLGKESLTTCYSEVVPITSTSMS